MIIIVLLLTIMHKKGLCILNFKETKESQEKLSDKPNFPDLILKKKKCSYILKVMAHIG